MNDYSEGDIDDMDVKPIDLIVDGERYLSSGDSNSLNFHEEFKARLENNNPNMIFTLKPFSVAILKFDLQTNIATEWQKEKGYSLWEKS